MLSDGGVLVSGVHLGSATDDGTSMESKNAVSANNYALEKASLRGHSRRQTLNFSANCDSKHQRDIHLSSTSKSDSHLPSYAPFSGKEEDWYVNSAKKAKKLGDFLYNSEARNHNDGKRRLDSTAEVSTADERFIQTGFKADMVARFGSSGVREVSAYRHLRSGTAQSVTTSTNLVDN